MKCRLHTLHTPEQMLVVWKWFLPEHSYLDNPRNIIRRKNNVSHFWLKSWDYQNSHCPSAPCITNHRWWKGLAQIDLPGHPKAFLSPTHMIAGQEETLALIPCFSMALPVGFEIDEGAGAAGWQKKWSVVEELRKTYGIAKPPACWQV